jgi:DNA end-binding protein Ku
VGHPLVAGAPHIDNVSHFRRLTVEEADVAVRPTWKGFLKVSLVNIPIKVFPATESSATISFNQLHAECRTRIQQKRWCPKCNKEVPNSDLVKGYEFEKGQYVVVTEEDMEKVRTESTRVIDLVQFADESGIDPIYVDRAYYLAPDGAMAADAFAVMREGMKGKAGIGKLALYGREYLVAVRPQEKGLVMYTLHHAAEIRDINQIEELESVPKQVKPQEMKLAKQVIDTFEADLNLKDYKDEYREGLMEIIQAKIEGKEVVAPAVETPPKVVNLMDALRRSLDSVSTSKKPQARMEEPRRAVAASKAPAAKKRARA